MFCQLWRSFLIKDRSYRIICKNTQYIYLGMKQPTRVRHVNYAHVSAHFMYTPSCSDVCCHPWGSRLRFSVNHFIRRIRILMSPVRHQVQPSYIIILYNIIVQIVDYVLIGNRRCTFSYQLLNLNRLSFSNSNIWSYGAEPVA